MKRRRKPPTMQQEVRQLQVAVLTIGKVVSSIQRMLKRDRKRVITGFAQAEGFMVETEDGDE